MYRQDLSTFSDSISTSAKPVRQAFSASNCCSSCSRNLEPALFFFNHTAGELQTTMIMIMIMIIIIIIMMIMHFLSSNSQYIMFK